LLSRLHVGGGAGEGSASPPGAGSDGYASEHGTVTYPSPTSDSERVNMGTARIGQSPILPQTSASSELALALHSNESSPYTPPPAFKFSQVDVRASPQPHLPQEYPPYGMTTFAGGEYSHPHANGYPVPAYLNTFDRADGSVYPQPVPPPSTPDDYTATTQYT